MSEQLHKYGRYGCEEGWAIYSQCERDIARLVVYHLANSLRAGDRPAECVVQPPAGRTLVEYAAAAWTPFYARLFMDAAAPAHCREPAWLAFATRLEQILTACADVPLERVAQHVYDELLAAPMVKYLAQQRKEWEEDRPFGLWRYDARNDYIALHIHNVYMPESPFAHMPQLFASLGQIIDDIDSRGLKIARIGVDSWINSMLPFQRLFPAEFATSLAPTTRDAKGGNGWWGQFISRTGHLHEPRAQRLRQMRRFDYVRTHGECSFARFREHVKQANSN